MATLLSVGIDVGTTTTQVVFSHILVDNVAGYFTAPRVSITGREILYRSEVHLTPLQDRTRIDGAALKEIVRREFRLAGVQPEDVDTGAVIITGESARKENAAIVLENLSAFAGEFVVSTAGPDLESTIAGKGSGACRYSEENECRVLNLDIGGGTTNLALFDCGELVHLSCYDIGGHLILLERDGTIKSVSPAAGIVAEAEGIPLQAGQRVPLEALGRIADRMGDLLACAAGLGGDEALLEKLRTPNSAPGFPPAKGRVCFSGGVAECIVHPPGDPLAYGDLGVLLGRAIRNGRLLRELEQIPAQETISATVIGAGIYTTSLSGSTIFVGEGILPLKNVPALRLSTEAEAQCLRGESGKLGREVGWFLEQGDAAGLLLCMDGSDDPTYDILTSCADALFTALNGQLPPGAPLLIAVRNDTAKALGSLLNRRAGGARPVCVIDAVAPQTGEFVDIGAPIMSGLVVPVAVKTLLFG